MVRATRSVHLRGQAAWTVDIHRDRQPGMPPRVCLVDDDALVTESLGTALRLETDWDVVAWNDATEALAVILAPGAALPDVVVSDLKMPKMDGIAFLSRVRKRCPDAVLLLLTGYADQDSAIAAIRNDRHSVARSSRCSCRAIASSRP